MSKQIQANRYFFGLGTVGRDMLYALVSMYLVIYFTEILDLSAATMWWLTGVFTVLRIFDAVNDPLMGYIIDNTQSRYGKFKPWIAIGGFFGGILTVLLFTDLGLTGPAFVLTVGLFYLLWDLAYGVNDIAYWSMLPALSIDQKEREKTGAFARICANIGLFAVVVGIIPITTALGSDKNAWFIFALLVTLVTWFFLLFTLFGVEERRDLYKKEARTSLRELFITIFRNDQLLYTAIAMGLFMIGYSTTTSFGVYYFKYAYRDEGMYSVFAAILGLSQLGALSLFNLFARRYTRKQLYTFATALVVLGYIIFFVAPERMMFIGPAGVLIFFGEAFIQLLMLMFLADTVEYGQWKLGRRNESITFSAQPLIYKIGAALSTGIVMATTVLSGINEAVTPDEVTADGLFLLKIAMLILPLICIVAGFLIYLFNYKIDPELFDRILTDLAARGDIKLKGSEQFADD